MDYNKLVSLIPSERWQLVCDRLIDSILTSKNDEKMPSQLASRILRHWQKDALDSESGLTTLLEAAMLLEPEKTISAFGELQMSDIAGWIKTTLKS